MLNSDYSDMLSEFNAAGVEYLVVGAFAVAAHGLPRATGDMNLWVRPTQDNAARVMEALRRFGAPLDDVTQEDFASPDVVFQIGVAPRRIDIMTCIQGVTFDDAWNERMETAIGDLVVPVIGCDHLLINGRAGGPARDRAGAAALARRARNHG